ncbi:hypothetical protein M422DRAFT_213760 [Sphaerobolus stellatus SS14]|uniref:Glycosyl transferase family 25 domain-containing protein n=1 Tax=Sphaerobolus stellatus (strain SS14) TaxID=990650 RepID=A0A0C9V4T8_SPHS4|nr:hypothetical protein M422DRAFT_213760 [Sphaerobolus stellatus SS14]
MGLLTFRYPAIIILTLVAGSLLYLWQESFSLADRIASLSPSGSGFRVEEPPSYHDRLSQVRPLDTAPHSKTLGVAGKVYVVSLPKRTDRRGVMQEIADAMDIELTFHDATDMRGPEVRDIMERIRWWRNEHRVDSSMPKDDPTPFTFSWADDVNSDDSMLGLSGSDLWSSGLGESPLSPLPPAPTPDKRPPVLDTFGEKGNHFGRSPLRPAQIACWVSHYKLLRKIAEGPDDVAIILEDDVDIEWDLESRLRKVWSVLPNDWDMVLLGYCGDKEWTNPPIHGAPTLHPSFSTLCTHAYAVNKRSAARIVRRLRSEAFSYSRPIDHAYYHLYAYKETKSFSIYPPVVVQTYELDSDIAPGRPKSDRSQWLGDSTLERIQLFKEKMEVDNNSSYISV